MAESVIFCPANIEMRPRKPSATSATTRGGAAMRNREASAAPAEVLAGLADLLLS